MPIKTSRESLIGLVVSLVLTRLDYCNAVLAGLPAYQLDRLQSAINAAARMIGPSDTDNMRHTDFVTWS